MSGGALSAEFHVVFEREFHVGAGHGRKGGVDSALFTDTREGREEPAIRYGHGVLRQAVYDLLTAGEATEALRGCRESGLGDDEFCSIDREPCPVCRIFGSAARPSPWSFSTLRPTGAVPASHAGARAVSRAAIDPRTRRAGDGTLFAEELGAPRTFSFVAERSEGGEGALDELALLVAAARTVRGIGAERRRGRGECTVALASVDGVAEAEPTRLLDRFVSSWLGERGPASAAPARGKTVLTGSPSAALWEAPTDGGEWTAFRLVLRLDEPLIAGSLPLTGNLLQGEPFVPGTLLLGALAGRVLAAGADEAAFLRTFRAGAVRFPDLHPLEGRLPVIPAPRDLVTCERAPGPGPGGHGVWSRLLDAELRECPVCREEGKDTVKLGKLDGWLVPAGADRWRSTFSTAEETKIAVDRGTGRVEDRSLYHREVLPAGTLLTGTLRVRSDALADLRGWGLLGDEGSLALRLGKRHGRGYGAATLSWNAARSAGEAVRTRIEGLVVPGAAIPLVAASRVLLRDAFGRARQSLTAADVGLPAGVDGGCAVAVRPVGGFWRHIGLPRRQEAALEPGSVLMVRVPDALEDGVRGELVERLTAMEELVERLTALAMEEPVGERTAEGFGRFAVGPFPYGWLENGGAFAGADPRFAEVAVPEAWGSAAGVAAGLRDDPRSRARDGYADALAGLDLADDRWRAVARFLYARAGSTAAEMVDALQGGSGKPMDALRDAGADRGERHYLKGDRAAGGAGWKIVEPLVRRAAAGEDEALRAMRTRALADALALSITPGKVLA